MGFGSALPAVLQGVGESVGGMGQQLTQLLGLMRIDQRAPKRAQEITKIGDLFDRKGQGIWGGTLDTAQNRAGNAASWMNGSGEQAGIQNNYQQFTDAQGAARRDLDQDMGDLRTMLGGTVARATALRESMEGVASQHTANVMSQAATAQSQFQADRTAALDSLHQNFQYDLAAQAAGNDQLANNLVNEGVKALQDSGAENDPLARFQMESGIRQQYTDQLANQRGQRMAAYENTLAATHTALASDRAALNSNVMSALNQAFGNEQQTRAFASDMEMRQRTFETQANQRINEFSAGFATQQARDRTHVWMESQNAAQQMAGFLNGVDREVAATRYQMAATQANIELGAEAYLAQGDFAGAGMLYNWGFTVPGYADMAASMRQPSGGGGGGGSSGSVSILGSGFSW